MEDKVMRLQNLEKDLFAKVSELRDTKTCPACDGDIGLGAKVYLLEDGTILHHNKSCLESFFGLRVVSVEEAAGKEDEK